MVDALPSLVAATDTYSKVHENKEEPEEYVADFVESLHLTKKQCQIIERVKRAR